MEFHETVRARKSVRAYEDRPLEEEVLTRILDAARLSPSAKNLQPWHFIVVRDAEKRKKLAEGMWAKFLREAPAVIVGCGDSDASPDWSIIDTAIALQTLVLAATAEGVGTCWVGSFDEKSVRELLSVPEKYDIVCLISIGYERGKRDIARALVGGKNRKSLAETVSYEKFGQR